MATRISQQNVADCLRAMRAGGWSRNRHFDEHRTPEAAQARSLMRLLRSIERDLQQGGALVGAEHSEGHVTLRTHNPVLRLERALRLTHDEFALLASVSPLFQPLSQATGT